MKVLGAEPRPSAKAVCGLRLLNHLSRSHTECYVSVSGIKPGVYRALIAFTGSMNARKASNAKMWVFGMPISWSEMIRSTEVVAIEIWTWEDQRSPVRIILYLRKARMTRFHHFQVTWFLTGYKVRRELWIKLLSKGHEACDYNPTLGKQSQGDCPVFLGNPDRTGKNLLWNKTKQKWPNQTHRAIGFPKTFHLLGSNCVVHLESSSIAGCFRSLEGKQGCVAGGSIGIP